MGQAFSRQALYELVWNEPRTALAKKLEVSDAGLAKACTKANIPMPPRGYWARVAAGKRIVEAPLPTRALGQSDTVRVGRLDHRVLACDEALRLPPEPFFNEPIEIVRTRAANLLVSCKIPKGLGKPHRLIAMLLDEDAVRRRALETDRFTWDKPQFDSAPALRRVRIVNALFVAMTHAGCQATVSSKDLHKVAFSVGHACINVEIESRHSKAHVGPGVRRMEHERITLKATGWPKISGFASVWSDSDTQLLETRVLEISRDLLVLGEFTYRAAAYEQHKWRVERKHKLEADALEVRDRLKREENEQRLRQETEQREWLLLQATNRRHADEIRALINALDVKHQVPSEVLGNDAYSNWRAWALAQADLFDPCLQPLISLITPPSPDADGNSLRIA